MKKWIGILLACLLPCSLLTGCGAMQLEDRLLVVSLAVDQTAEGKLALTVQVPNAAQTSGASGEKAEQGAEGHTLITVEGKDWQVISDALEEQSPHALSFTQLRQIIVSQSLAESDQCSPLLASIAGEHQVRSNAQVVITADSGKVFLQKQKPDVGQHLGKYLDTVLKNQITKDNVPNAALALVVRDGQDSGKDPPLIMAQVSEADKITYLGAALTRNGRMVGHLTAEETRLLALLEGGGRAITLPVGEDLRVEVTARSGAKVKIQGEQANVKVIVTAYAPAGKTVTADQVETALKQKLDTLISKLQKARSDAAGFKRHTLQSDWDFATASVSVAVKAQVVIRRGN